MTDTQIEIAYLKGKVDGRKEKLMWKPGVPTHVGLTWLLWPDGSSTTDVVRFGRCGRGSLESGRALFDCTHHCPISAPVMPDGVEMVR